jgi:hypothetical protein
LGGGSPENSCIIAFDVINLDIIIDGFDHNKDKDPLAKLININHSIVRAGGGVQRWIKYDQI